MASLNLRPLGDRVVVKPLEREEVTASGIVLPDTAKEKPQQGELLAVGPGKMRKDGSRAEPQVKVGDTILFTNWAGDEFKEKPTGNEILVMREEDVLAVLGE